MATKKKTEAQNPTVDVPTTKDVIKNTDHAELVAYLETILKKLDNIERTQEMIRRSLQSL